MQIRSYPSLLGGALYARMFRRIRWPITRNSALADTTGSRRKSRFGIWFTLSCLLTRPGRMSVVFVGLRPPWSSHPPWVVNRSVLPDACHDHLEQVPVFRGEPVGADRQEVAA